MVLRELQELITLAWIPFTNLDLAFTAGESVEIFLESRTRPPLSLSNLPSFMHFFAANSFSTSEENDQGKFLRKEWYLAFSKKKKLHDHV